MAILRAAATASFTLDATSFTLITGLIHSDPAADDYHLFATIEVENASSGGVETNEFAVFVGGSEVTHTVRWVNEETSLDIDRITCAITCRVSPNGSQDVEIRHQASGSSSPQLAFRREIALFPIPDAGTDYEDSDTVTDTLATATWTTLDNMSRTPVAGDYLLTFTASGEGPDDADMGYRIEVGGTEVAHSHRQFANENSLPDTARPLMIAALVSPNGSQVVEIAWSRIDGSGTISCLERTMNLIPINTDDSIEATGTADDAVSSTTDVQIDDMLIADPGDNDWLMYYSAHDSVGTMPTGENMTVSIRSGGSTVTDSERRNDHEGSLDNTNLPVLAGGRITPASATDDVAVFWARSSSDGYTMHQRTFVIIREASAPVFTAALRSRLAIRAASGGAKTFVGVGQHSAAMSAAAAAQKTYTGAVQASLALRTTLDGVRTYLAAIVARIAVTSRSAAAKQAEAAIDASLALRALDASATVRGGAPVARLAIRSLNGSAKTSTGIAVQSFGLRSFTTAQKTFDGTASMNFALRPGSAGQKVADGIGAHSFSVRVTSEGVAIFAVTFPYHVIKENDRDMRAMITL